MPTSLRLPHPIQVGDQVIRTRSSYDDMVIGDTGTVTEVTRLDVTIRLHNSDRLTNGHAHGSLGVYAREGVVQAIPLSPEPPTSKLSVLAGDTPVSGQYFRVSCIIHTADNASFVDELRDISPAFADKILGTLNNNRSYVCVALVCNVERDILSYRHGYILNSDDLSSYIAQDVTPHFLEDVTYIMLSKAGFLNKVKELVDTFGTNILPR